MTYRENTIYNIAMDTKEIIKALDNDFRMQILAWLKDPENNFPPQGMHLPEGTDFEGGVCVGSICDKAGISQSTVSHYLDILQRSGLLESLRAGKWTYYRRNEEVIGDFIESLRNEL